MCSSDLIRWAENVSASTKLKILLDSGHLSVAECPLHSGAGAKVKTKAKAPPPKGTSTTVASESAGVSGTEGSPYTSGSDNDSANANEDLETDEETESGQRVYEDDDFVNDREAGTKLASRMLTITSSKFPSNRNRLLARFE